MAAHDRLLVEEELEYDYEGLPPNFSLAANMTAGAFAGIAVCGPATVSKITQLIRS